MNSAQLHLALNHLPVMIPLVATPILTVGVLTRSASVRNVGLCLLVFSALAAVPVYLSGDPAEQLLKNYPGVSRMAIHQHEDAATLSLVSLEVVGLLSLFLLYFTLKGRNVSRLIWSFQLLFTVASFILMMRTAHLGGEIRHEEIQTAEILQSAN